jgi:hypothetical protein
MKILSSFVLITGMAFITAHTIAQAPAVSSTAQNKNVSDANAMAQQLTNAVKQAVTGVTQDQESNILAVEKDYSKGVIDVRNSTSSNMTSSDKMAKYNQLGSLKETRDAKIKTILTADQYTQYQKTSPPMPSTMPAQQQPGK